MPPTRANNTFLTTANQGQHPYTSTPPRQVCNTGSVFWHHQISTSPLFQETELQNANQLTPCLLTTMSSPLAPYLSNQYGCWLDLHIVVMLTQLPQRGQVPKIKHAVYLCIPAFSTMGWPPWLISSVIARVTSVDFSLRQTCLFFTPGVLLIRCNEEENRCSVIFLTAWPLGSP